MPLSNTKIYNNWHLPANNPLLIKEFWYLQERWYPRLYVDSPAIEIPVSLSFVHPAFATAERHVIKHGVYTP